MDGKNGSGGSVGGNSTSFKNNPTSKKDDGTSAGNDTNELADGDNVVQANDDDNNAGGNGGGTTKGDERLVLFTTQIRSTQHFYLCEVAGAIYIELSTYSQFGGMWMNFDWLNGKRGQIKISHLRAYHCHWRRVWTCFIWYDKCVYQFNCRRRLWWLSATITANNQCTRSAPPLHHYLCLPIYTHEQPQADVIVVVIQRTISLYSTVKPRLHHQNRRKMTKVNVHSKNNKTQVIRISWYCIDAFFLESKDQQKKQTKTTIRAKAAIVSWIMNSTT